MHFLPPTKLLIWGMVVHYCFTHIILYVLWFAAPNIPWLYIYIFYKWAAVKIGVDYLSKGGSSFVEKVLYTKPRRAIGNPQNAITCNHMRMHETWCEPCKYCCVPSRNIQNWWRQFNLRRPRFLQFSYHTTCCPRYWCIAFCTAGSCFFSQVPEQ